MPEGLSYYLSSLGPNLLQKEPGSGHQGIHMPRLQPVWMSRALRDEQKYADHADLRGLFREFGTQMP